MAGKFLKHLWQFNSSIKKIGYYFRIITTKQKLSSVRPLAYVVFAYAFTFSQISLLSLVNIIVITIIIGTSYFLNDYYDSLIRKEENFSQLMLQSRQNVSRFLRFWVGISIVSSIIFSIVLIKYHSQSLILVSLLNFGMLIAFIYSWPPLRLKDRWFGPLVFPLATVLLFLESWTLHEKIGSVTIVLGFLILIFQSYLEILHQIEDSQQINEKIRIKINTARKIGITLLIIGGLTTLSVGITLEGGSIFILGTIFWFIRLFTFSQTPPTAIPLLRSKVSSPLLSVYEFLIYALFGFLGNIG